MKKAGYPVIPLVLGLILGPMLESEFRRAVMLAGTYTTFFTRPLSLALLLLGAAYLVHQTLKMRREAATGPSRRSRVMRLCFLGTGAAEEVPSVWCACTRCRRIRQLGGRNRRRNACSYLEPGIVIDHPPTLTSQAWDAGVDLSAVNHLVFTHGNMDHFYPHLFRWRQGDGTKEPQGAAPVVPRYDGLPHLTVYGSEKIVQDVKGSLRGSSEEALNMTFQPVTSARPFLWAITASRRFPAITQSQTTRPITISSRILRETPSCTGWTAECRRRRCGSLSKDESSMQSSSTQPWALAIRGLHPTTWQWQASARWSGASRVDVLSPRCQIVLSHINANHWPPHDEAEPLVAKEGYVLSYDGMWLEIRSAAER